MRKSLVKLWFLIFAFVLLTSCGEVLYQYSLKSDSAIYSEGNSAVVTMNQWEQYVQYYLLAGKSEGDAKTLATKKAKEREALYSAAIRNGYYTRILGLSTYGL